MFSGPDQQTPISIPISADLDDNLENTKEENNYIKRSIMELRTIRNVRKLVVVLYGATFKDIAENIVTYLGQKVMLLLYSHLFLPVFYTFLLRRMILSAQRFLFCHPGPEACRIGPCLAFVRHTHSYVFLLL